MFDIINHDSWNLLNSKIAKQIGLNKDSGGLRFYQSVTQGVREVAIGLRRQLPHKNKVFCLSGITPYIEDMSYEFSRSGVKLISVDIEELKNPENFCEKIDRETLAVILPVDDPVLGEIYQFDNLVDLLDEKRAYSLSISHREHRGQRPWDGIRKYELKLCSLEGEGSVLFYGQRSQLPSFCAETLSWDGGRMLDQFEKVFGEQNQDKDFVKNFELAGVAESKAYFSGEREDIPRVYDRAILYWEDMDGYALIDQLSKELGRDLAPPGKESWFEATSLSRWGGVRTMDWLKAKGLSPERIRGLVCFSLEALKSPGFNNHLAQARTTVLKRARAVFSG